MTALLPTYAPPKDLVFERGEGAWLITDKGERFVDFMTGVAVTALGHAHPRLVAALTEQAQKVWQISNHFRIAPQERFAEKLAAATFADRVFFCNSGAEALEASIKMARRYHWGKGHPERFHLITFEGAFHGRTLANLAATNNAKYLEGFGTKVEGFVQVPLGDLEAVKAAIGPETAGILIEPIQGEGGVRVPPRGFLKALRKLCDEHGLLLVLDEVQSGMGRTGKLFAHELEGVKPDIMAVAKAVGGGFPLGACLATAEAAQYMTVGSHGSTYGGNPLGTAVGAAVLDVMLEPGFLESVREKGLRFKQRLAQLKDEYPSIIEEVRGEGLLLGLKIKPPVGDLQKACFEEKLLVIPAGENVLRLLPPLTLTDAEMSTGLDRLSKAMGRLARPAQSGSGQSSSKSTPKSVSKSKNAKTRS
jgi:acetylornithine/N-succinyldiaminopimelate aminotransferase